MPDAEKRGRNGSGGVEVKERERCRHAGVLHADLDAHGAPLRRRESEERGERVAEHETDDVVQDDGEGDERPDFGEARRAHGDDDADQKRDGQGGDGGQIRHSAPDSRAEEVVDRRAQEDGQEHHLGDGQHHRGCVDSDLFPRQKERQKRRDEGGEECRCHRHDDRECHVAFCEIGDDVRCRAAGAGADENDADREVGRQGKRLDEEPGSERHDGELCRCADRHFPRTLREEPEVLELERHAHAEHDESEEIRHLRRESGECRRKDGTEGADEHDEPDHVPDEVLTDVLQEDSSHQKSLPAKRQKGIKSMKSRRGHTARAPLLRASSLSRSRRIQADVPLRYSFVAG